MANLLNLKRSPNWKHWTEYEVFTSEVIQELYRAPWPPLSYIVLANTNLYKTDPETTPAIGNIALWGEDALYAYLPYRNSLTANRIGAKVKKCGCRVMGYDQNEKKNFGGTAIVFSCLTPKQVRCALKAKLLEEP